ncbi:TlpA family protein disulfide reductase [Novosphingobium lentum]|uniref:TlpA family protein disulfide reductase n=1 Tax=Novosphingobium lentum TaxID=145287 RepID=UPI00082F4FEC|nr:TlpA disulfide reductase family protein [Novosphingobium lentum]
MIPRFVHAAFAVALFAGAAPSALARLPDTLSARTIDGATVSLASTHGQVLVVNFWATWCAPCRAEMPALDAVYRRHRGQSMQMVAVSLDAGASTAKLATATRGFAFPVALIAETKIARRAIPTRLPVTRIYGRDGRLRYDSAELGGRAMTEVELEQVLAPLLAEAAPSNR